MTDALLPPMREGDAVRWEDDGQVRVTDSQNEGRYCLFLGTTYLGEFLRADVTPLANALTIAVAKLRPL